MIPVSALLITKNEAHRIVPTLECLQWCSEIIVVDSGSTDATAEICARYGARVVQQPFLGFGRQKQFAVNLSKNDWVLSLDADEVLSPALSAEIQHLLHQQPQHTGYYLRRKLVFMNKVFRYGKESRDHQLRLFNRNQGRWTEKEVHESVQVDGSTGKLQHALLHTSYDDLHQYLEKFNRYTTLAAGELKARGKKRSHWLIVASFPFYFLQQYLFKGNFLNGFPGYIWSLLSAVYPVVKYSKAGEKNS